MDLSIIFATYHSEEILEKSLKAYCEIKTKHQWELIIVDNAHREETQQIINLYLNKLPIKFIEKSLPGKNNALNKALSIAKSELIWFTDNDILPNKSLIDTYIKAAKEYEKIDIFGGNIMPDRSLPSWVDTSAQKIKAAYGILNLGLDNKEIPAENLWGGNMLIRRALFQGGVRFGTKVCSTGNNHIMGNETELLKRLERAGHQTMYIANNSVRHQIRDEQISFLWLVNRAFNAGAGAAYSHKKSDVKMIFGVPRYLFKVFFVDISKVVMQSFTFNKSKICIAFMNASMTIGRMKQYFQDR